VITGKELDIAIQILNAVANGTLKDKRAGPDLLRRTAKLISRWRPLLRDTEGGHTGHYTELRSAFNKALSGTPKEHWTSPLFEPDRPIAKYVAWDIETATIVPDGEDWDKYRPYGISCAATLTSDGELRVWHGDKRGGEYATRMTPTQCQQLAQYLVELHAEGYQVVGFNSAKYDFDVLAEECQDIISFDNLVELTWDSIDPGFQMLCEVGYMTGLNKLAKGMGLAGKLTGVSGKDAPAMWRQGAEAQQTVLKYVAQDARTTAELYEAAIKQSMLRWTSRSGKTAVWQIKGMKETEDGWRTLTVREANELPLPDTSWMKEPWPRSGFTQWLEGKGDG